MALFKKKKRPKVCVIGLDGVPYSLVTDLARRGIMSSMSALIQRGHLHELKASLPEISAVSWTNFMTGTNPGTHGIFGFTDFKPGSYQVFYPNFLDDKCPTFWDKLGAQGKKSIVINQPATYPARPVNGVLISGFVAIDLAKAVYPPSQKDVLERMGYQIDIDTVKSRENHDFLWQELFKTLTSGQKALNHFWDEDWDYFEFVITGTDRLHHFLWHSYADEKRPFHREFLDYYRKIDGLINEIDVSFCKLTGGDDGLYLLSDHGFCGIDQEVYLNAWLEKEGYLKFSTSVPTGLEDITDESVAFALDPNRLYLNLEQKFPRGIVAPSVAESLKDEIRQKLEKLEFEGRKVVKQVFDCRDIYSGPHLSLGPDLIAVAECGFDFKGSVKKKEIFGRTDLQGMHTWDDAFFWANRPLGENLAISDLAGIVLENFR
ncbi:MAG: alkaline phosphatase family protein [Clostridiales bacterium]|nr:alkaline phosphatase family protein [Clostridiales bacterium]